MAGAIIVGAVAVEVVPSAKGFSKKLADQLMPNAAGVGQKLGKTIGDNLNKQIVAATRAGIIKGGQGLKITPSVDKAGQKKAENDLGKFVNTFKAKLGSVTRLVPKFDDDAELDDVQGKVRDLREALEELGKVDVTLDPDGALQSLREIETAAKHLTSGHYDVDVQSNARAVLAGARDLQKQLRAGLDLDYRSAESEAGKFVTAYQSKVSALGKDIPTLTIREDSSEADKAIANLKNEIESLKDFDLNVDGNVTGAEAKLAEVEALAQGLVAKDYNVTITSNARGVLAQITALRAQLREGLNVPVDLDVNTKDSEAKIGAFGRLFRQKISAALDAIPPVEINVDSRDVDVELAAIQARLRELHNIDITVGANVGIAEVKLAELLAVVRELNGTNVDIDVKTNLGKALAALGVLDAAMHAADGEADDLGRTMSKIGGGGGGGGGGGIESATQSFGRMSAQAALANSAILILGSALFALSPIAVPIATTVVGGIVAVGTAAVFAVGGLLTLGIALSGVISGLQKYIQQRQQSAQLAAQELSQSTSLANAQDSVTTATRNLARAQTNAAKSVRQANQSLKNAETTLTDAQRSQKKAQTDLTQARKDATRQLQELNLEVTRGMLDQREATLDLQDARQTLTDVQNDPGATEEERQRALLGYQQQQQSLAEIAQKNKENAQDKAKADKTGVDGTDTVINALESLRSANEQVVSSQQAVVDAAQAAADAQISAADSVKDAQQSLIQSQRALAVALAQPAAGSDWTQGLTKSEQDFVTYLYATFVPAYKRVKAIVEAPIFAGLKKFFDDLLPYEGIVDSIFGHMAGAVGDFFVNLGKFTQGAHFQAFLKYLDSNGNSILATLGDALIAVADAFVQIIVAFGPSSDKIITAVADMVISFANFFAGFAKSGNFDKFIAYMDKNGPIIVGLLGNLLVGFGKLGVALAPLGQDMARAVAAFADFMSQFTPTQLLLIAGLAATLLAILAAAAGTLLVIPLLVAAMVLLFGVLYKIGFYKTLWNAIKTAWSASITAIAKVIDFLMDHTVEMRAVFALVFEAIAAIVKVLYYVVFKPIFLLIAALLQYVVFPVLKFLYYSVIKPVFALIGVAVSILYIAFRIAFELIKLLLLAVGDVFTSLYRDYIKPAWEKGIKPVLSFIAPYFTKYVLNPLRDGIKELGSIWDGLVKLIGTPIYAIVHYVLNDGLLKAVNTVFHTFDKSWKDASIPDTTLKKYSFFSEGGVLPGYAPRRDSVPAMLSPGEGVLVPEAVREIGPAQILDWNAKARAGRSIQHFADGGLVGGIVSFEKNAQVPFKVSSGYRAGDTGYHGLGEAVDATSSTPHMVQLARWLYQRSAYLLELIHSAGNDGQGFFVKNGRQVGRGFYGDEVAKHYNHVHVAMNQTGLDKAKAAGYAVTDAGTGEEDADGTSLTDVLGGLTGTIASGITAGVNKLKSLAGDALNTPFLGEVLKLPGMTVKKALSYAKDFLGGLVGKTIGAVKNAAVSAYDFITGKDEENAKKGKGYHASQGTAQAYAKAALPGMGWDAGQWSSLNPLWQGESSWRWNATGDLTSLGRAYGIPQSLPADKLATAGTDWHDNAFTQIKWGLDYIKDRYGDPAGAFAFWEAQSPHYYDSGGYLPPGISLVRNDTGKPEPVLTDHQWQSMLDARQAAANGSMEVGIRVHDGAVPGLVSAQVDKAFGVLADANIYGGI